ncbi:MAG: ABC-three component system middle component 2 [Hyphomicrobium sp.]
MDSVSVDEFGDLFNSRLEAGIRAVVVLESLRPETADLSEMVLFDHVVVHTYDVGGPPSLHADLPGRKGELLVRRRLVEASLELMRRCHLVEQDNVEDGLVWRASDDAASYVELLQTAYSTHLKACAAWVGQEVRARTKAGFKDFVRREFGDWSEAFSAYGAGAAERG